MIGSVRIEGGRSGPVKAIRVHEYGDESVLRYEEVADPEPAPRRLVVKVEAASINRGDLARRQGTYGGGLTALPFTPGWEVAGTVEALGEGVEGFAAGDRVIAQMGDGGYAEKALVHQGGTFKMPEGMSFEEGCSIPVVFLTAWFALRKLCRLQANEMALIQAGGSGVGIAAIQIAKLAGARVITTAGSDEKCGRCLELGADHATNYREKDFVQEVNRITEAAGADVVLESVGGEVFEKSLAAMGRYGRLCVVGNSSGQPNSVDPRSLMFKNLTVSAFYLGAEIAAGGAAPAMEDLLRLLQQGKLRTVIDRTFPLSETAAAHRYLGERRNFGKVVLVP
jgi:NADPH2:quinone reductase